MNGTTAPNYDAAAADLVVRTLRAVAEATPVDSAHVNVDTDIAVLPRADIDMSVRRRRRARWLVSLTAAAAVVSVVAAVWTRDDGRVETSRPSEPPPEAPRPLAKEQVVARGEVDGELWRLKAQPFGNGIICVELRGGGCGGMPTDEAPLGGVFRAWDSIDGSRFVFGAVIREAAEVTVELANGEELTVDASQPAFGFRFYVIPIPARPDAVAVTARDANGAELGRLEIAPPRGEDWHWPFTAGLTTTIDRMGRGRTLRR
jgi:hypothetical protein